jgi:hypothetical protein
MVSTRSSSQALAAGGLAVGLQLDVPRSQMVIPNSQAAQVALVQENPLLAELLQPLPELSRISKGKWLARGPPLGSPELEGYPGALVVPGGGSEPSDLDPDNLDYPSPFKNESSLLTRRRRTPERTTAKEPLLTWLIEALTNNLQ